ncbi:YhdP family protein [Limnohabitans sp.]|uniref:YhdP family protein n=1 Tax=Limnohabitans sp. TaxID=1907725 RepID=UPI0025C165AD|nr:YhdP family protein [Limnohabitans sp.]
MSSSPTWPPTETPLRPWLARAVRLVLWGLLVAGLVMGLAWATLHFWIVPRIAEFRPALESLARQSLGVPVRIGGVSAQSTGWVPSFELRDIELQDTQGRPALHLPKVLVALSLRSAALGQLDQLVLDAPELTLRLLADGQWQIAGIHWRPSNADSPAADWLLRQREVVVRGAQVHWHGPGSGQNPTPGQAQSSPEPLTLRDVDLVIRNTARQHLLRLDATPPPGWGERFVLMGQFKRGLLSLHPGRLSDWSGQAFAHFPQLNMAPWSAQGLQLPANLLPEAGHLQGQGRLRLWADVQAGQWRGGLADVDLKNLQARLGPNQPPLALQSLTGRLGLQVHAEGFVAQTHDLRVTGEQGLSWPGGELSLDYTHAQGTRPASGHLQAAQLDLQALQALALRLPLGTAMPPRLRTALQARDVLGRVTSLGLRWQGDWTQPDLQEAQAKVEGLSWQPGSDVVAAWGTLPGADVPGLRGGQLTLALSANGGQVDLQTGAGSALWLPGLIEPAEVPLQQLQASLRWARETDKGQATGPWHVPQWSLSLANADLQGQWQGQWRPGPQGQGPGVLSLQGRIQRAQAAAVHRYLPLNLPPEVRHYLRDALVQGRYEEVQVQIQGDLDKLPFATPEDGTFFFSGLLKDAEFDMVPASLMTPGEVPWPRLRALQGRLTFDRLGMQLREASAQVGEGAQAIALKAATVGIADMAHQPVLRVQAQSLADAPLVLGVVRQSPLNALLSGALQPAQASGPLLTRFALQLPLLDLASTRVQGSVQFDGNDLRMLPGTPWLNQLRGKLQFNERGFEVRQLQATLLGGPALIDGDMQTPEPVAGQAAPTSTPMAFTAQGRVSAAGLQAAHDVAPLNLLAQHASGATDYSARLAWHQGLPELTVNSRLAGLGLQLPAPLGKPAPAEKPLALQIRSKQTASGPQDEITLTLGDTARLMYVRDLSTDTPRVLRGQLGLGVLPGKLPALPESGVTASVDVDRLVVDEWLALLPTPAPAATPQTTPQPTNASTPGAPQAPSAWQDYLPTRLGLKANSLIANGRHLHRVQAGGTHEAGRWRVNIDAAELSGHVRFDQAKPGVSDQTDQAGQLFARLSRLTLPPASARDVESLLEAPPVSLPALDIVVDALELRGKQLGRVEIEAINADKGLAQTPAAREWQLKKFNIDLPEGTLRSTGRWLAAREGSPLRKSEMNFVLDVRDAGAMLTRLGTPDALRGGTGQIDGVVSWQGSPLDLHYPSLNGHLDVRMGRGQFLKADPGVAKLLGVLSLQALPRRLLFDFRDVFAQGFAFDSVQGDVTIVHGMANTRNLRIKGVNALVQLDGSADIARETQKLRVQILPIVDTGTASLVAAITVNPLVGLTTFIAQWLLQNPLSRASAQEFLVDGSWASPQVTRVESRPSSPPAPINPP